MLTLIVKTDDGARRKAVVKAGQEITIIRANPFLEKQGDYSLDIELPLAGCSENIKIFGPAHRTEIAKLPYVGKRYPARLYAPPVSLKGSITVTKVTEAILTVQFIGGYSEMTESFKDLDGAEMYIDQLDGMGKAWEEHDIFTEFYDGTWAELMKEENPLMAEEDKVGVVGLYNYVRYNIDKLGRAWENKWHLNTFAAQPDSTNYVAFPIMDAGKTVRNKWYPGNMQYEEIDGEPVPKYEHPSLLYLDLDDQAYDQGLAPQPYLFFALGKILKAIGYNLVYNELEGTWLNSIFIANAYPSLDLKDMLPHVKISDFIEEIERYLHVYIYVDGRDVYIYHNKLEDVGARERIREVVAEYEDSFEDPDTDAVLSANLWYNYKNKLPKTLSLEEDDYKNLIIRANGRDYNGILTGSNLHRMLEIKEDGRAYAYLYASEHHDANPYLAEVDQMGILFRDYTRMEADIKYKIQPARGSSYTIEKTVTYEVETPDAGELDPNAPGGTITWDNDWAIVGEKDVVDGIISGGNGNLGNIGTPSGGFNPGTGGGTIGGGTIGGGTGGIGNITLTSADVEPLSGGKPDGGYMYKSVHFTEYIPALYNDLEGATPTIGYQQAVLGEDAKERKDDGQIYIAANLGKNYKVSIYSKAYVPFAFALNQYTNAKDSDYILTQDGDYGDFSTPLTQEFHARNIDGIAHCPFALRETRKPCLQTDAWQQVSNVDTRVVHTVQFKDQAISFDPTATYIIHGRRFACKKIELKITDRGLSPLKTGYFYEIKD